MLKVDKNTKENYAATILGFDACARLYHDRYYNSTTKINFNDYCAKFNIDPTAVSVDSIKSIMEVNAVTKLKDLL